METILQKRRPAPSPPGGRLLLRGNRGVALTSASALIIICSVRGDHRRSQHAWLCWPKNASKFSTERQYQRPTVLAHMHRFLCTLRLPALSTRAISLCGRNSACQPAFGRGTSASEWSHSRLSSMPRPTAKPSAFLLHQCDHSPVKQVLHSRSRTSRFHAANSSRVSSTKRIGRAARRIGSSGRIRTYNPSVNSRMLYH